METYCVKCRKNTKNLNWKIFKRKNGGLIMQSKCAKSGYKKRRFVKEQEPKGSLSNSTEKKFHCWMFCLEWNSIECINWTKL